MVNKKPLKVSLIVFTIIGGLHSWSLMRFPQVFNDEAWLTSRAWAYLQTGLVFGPLDEGVFDRFEGYWTFLPWFPTFIQSISLKIYGSLSLLPVRILSLIFGMLLLVAIYIICISISDYRLAILSVIIIATSRSFMISAHVARSDIMAAAFGYFAIALILYDNYSHWWVGIISGLLVGIAFEIHPHSAIYVPTIIVLYLAKTRKDIFRNKQFWMFILGGLLSLFLYFSIHIFPYPKTYFALNRIAFTMTHLPPIFANDLRILSKSVIDLGYLITNSLFLSAPLILIAIIIQFRSSSDRTILYLVGAIIVSSILLIRNKFIEYGILITPILGILLADLTLKIWELFKLYYQRFRIVVVISFGIILGIIIHTSFLNIYQTIHDHQDDYQSVIYQIKEVINPSDVILAQQTYWFDFVDHKYYSWEALIYFQRYVPGSSLRDAFYEFRPDIFIVDNQLKPFITDLKGDSPYSKYLTISESELLIFLNNQAILVKEFDGGAYGQIRVFRINWKSGILLMSEIDNNLQKAY